MISVRAFWQMIEEALNDHDSTELMSVVNSFTNEQWEALAREALAQWAESKPSDDEKDRTG